MDINEAKALVEGLVIDAEYHPYAVYGLIFLFNSIRQAENNGLCVRSLCDELISQLFIHSLNFSEAEKALCRGIETAYRRADWTQSTEKQMAQPFLEEADVLWRAFNDDK